MCGDVSNYNTRKKLQQKFSKKQVVEGISFVS